ncbi:MAG TPA: prepilin-type N-terminal cleavage/methylation domain-containing protein [Candidatus Paceibacterota bacterium]|nr:prepilin-type N-terminal cleavage/methylation domain-containing protein [Verrucomicrobiota bacterium]HOX03981.1 prepilin-type N-terminal cleavage/methylation domain-containing protein [Verrucomicrobiota bacterium]HRZ46880.1 prepilin-type N-terminal cleavage/methylation domain-containing protein [Candidatus Paceibacterota bacterium]
MNLPRIGHQGATGRGRVSRVRRSGFTMIEIALCLAIIGFALVAIIGILPTGLQVQKDNRDETIVNADGAYFLEAIRQGAARLDHLTNYVDEISVVTSNYAGGIVTNLVLPTSGARIIGALTTPKYQRIQNVLSVNTVTAKVRSMSGAAVNAVSNEFAFSYLLRSEVVPYSAFATNSVFTNHAAANLPPEAVAERLELQARADQLHTNLFEVRLTLRWPVFGAPGSWRTGGNQQVFRTLVAGTLLQVEGEPLYFFAPAIYGN